MMGEELRTIRSEVCAGSVRHKLEFLERIEPVIKKFTGDRKKGSALKRRKRIMRNMALEMLYTGYIPEGESAAKFLQKFFSKVY